MLWIRGLMIEPALIVAPGTESIASNMTTGHVTELSLRDFTHENSVLVLNVSLFRPFEELRILDLSLNSFEGWIPNEGFPSLKKLETLDLSYNGLNFSSIIGLKGLTSLITLDLSVNSMDGLFSAQGPEYTQQSQYIGQTFIERNQPNTLFLAPYNTGDHWMLVVVNPTAEIVYYLDSLGVNIGQRLQPRRIAIKIYRANKGTKVSKVKFSNIKWTMIKYFSTYRLEKYSTELIDEVKQEWCRYVLENIITNK
ncbi:Papain-like cysteine peptidase superfamily [Sesbania bispinosa]|nr:Papain-like cysteine peptidase superfamily [Sesbania bispinosa]